MSAQPVEVEIRIAANGTVTPLRVMWQGRWATIAQISRHWADDSGDHWLVMIYPPELILTLTHTADGAWQAQMPGGGRVMV